MTSGMGRERRARVAARASIYMFVVLFVFLMLGALIMEFFGITLSSLRIAGGMIVGYIGFKMLFPSDTEAENEAIADAAGDKVAFTPLAMPMLSGPGAISVVMSMAAQIGKVENDYHEILGFVVVTAGIAISALICWLVLRASTSVIRFLGETGIDAMTKVMGFLLVAIGTEFFLAGLRDLGVLS